MSAPAQQQQQRPVLHLELKKLGARTESLGGGHDTPKSTRRTVSSKLSRYVNFFERSAFVKATTLDDLEGRPSSDSNDNDNAAPIATQTARATLTTVKVSPRPSALESADSGGTSAENRLASVREIIKRFDSTTVLDRRDSGGPLSHRSLRRGSSSSIIPAPSAHAPPQRSATLQPVPSTTSAPGAPPVIVKWQQVEKKVAGAVVGKVWRRCETEIPQTNVNSPRGALSENSYDSEPPAKADTSFAPIGEGNEEDSVESASSQASSRGGATVSRTDSATATAVPRKMPKADNASKTKRASHFVAIRIDDSEVVEAVRRFQSELTNSAPFLDHCRSNCNKLHLTLLVLSLGTAEIDRAKTALVTGVRRFMTAKAAMLASLKQGDNMTGTPNKPRRANGATMYNYEYNNNSRYYGQTTGSAASESDQHTSHHTEAEDCAFDLDFRTIGAFGTRVLFLSPPLRQRLLLQCFHVELARAFGDQGIPIVGAGSGWNSAMEIQKQVRGDCGPAEAPPPPPPPPPPVSTQATRQQSPVQCTAAPKAVPPTTMSESNSRPSSSAAQSAPPHRGESDPSQTPPAVRPKTQQQMSPPPPPPPPPPQPQPPSPAAAMMAASGPYPEVATALDKALIRQYDLSSARTTLYIPQITLFKISKAAKRSKTKGAQSPVVVPKLKLFPRLYHNLVQRVLQNGLPPPRPARRESPSPVVQQQCSAPPAVAYQPPGTYSADASASNNDYHQARGSTALHCYAAPPSSPGAPRGADSLYAMPQQLYVYQLPPPQSTDWSTIGKYHQEAPTTYMSVLPQHLYSVADGSGLYARSSSVDPPIGGPTAAAPPPPPPPQWVPPGAPKYPDYATAAAAAAVSSPPPDNNNPSSYQSPTKSPYYGGGGCDGRKRGQQHQSPHYAAASPAPPPRGYVNSPYSTPGRRMAANNTPPPPTHHRRLKIDKIITTSQLPKPPFGSQPCCFVELLEMSQMDPDGYYRRICRVKLSQQAEILEEISFIQPAVNKQPQDEDTTVATEVSPTVDFV